MMQIVVFAPNGSDARSALPEADAEDRVTVVQWGEGGGGAERILLRQPRLSSRIARIASRTLPGRMLLRVSPWDSGARFWRATARSGAVAERVRTADLLVAVDRDAGFAAWRWMRRRDGVAAVRGFAAARIRLTRQTAS